MAAWDLKPDRCTELSSCCAAAPPRKRGREGGRGTIERRGGGRLGTPGKLLGWNDGRASVSNQGPKEEIDFFAKVTKQHRSNNEEFMNHEYQERT